MGQGTVGERGLLFHRGDDVEPLVGRLTHVGLDAVYKPLAVVVDLARELEAQGVDLLRLLLGVVGFGQQLAKSCVDLSSF